jgi:hypothetical protein
MGDGTQIRNGLCFRILDLGSLFRGKMFIFSNLQTRVYGVFSALPGYGFKQAEADQKTEGDDEEDDPGI